MPTLEIVIFLILDEPELAVRFSSVITSVILKMGDIMDEEAGISPEDRGKYGFSFADDNCCLLNPEMYELFGYPVLRDSEDARHAGRGVNLSTAGSINDSSSPQSLRLIMALIQNYGRY